jgi:hypothetical protein
MAMGTENPATSGGTTRRGMIGRLALLAGGAAGAGVAWRAGSSGDDAAAVAPAGQKPVKRSTTTMRLHGADWRLAATTGEPGKLRGPGDVPVPKGRILDERRRELGIFRAAALPGSAGVFQLHTFDLAEGAILGIGGNRLDEATYAIVGGTGRFAGATGSYLARQSPREAGGDGTAEFTLTLNSLEA